MTGMLRRGDIVDLLVRDGESLVLTSHQCLRISSTGTAAILYLDQPRSVGALERHLESVFGRPPEGGVSRLVDDLVGAQVFESTTDEAQ